MQAGLQVERHGLGHEGPGSESRSVSAGSSVHNPPVLVTSFFIGRAGKEGSATAKNVVLPAVRVAPDAAGKPVGEYG